MHQKECSIQFSHESTGAVSEDVEVEKKGPQNPTTFEATEKWPAKNPKEKKTNETEGSSAATVVPLVFVHYPVE